MSPSLVELEAVLAVARHGGFRAAARELGVSSSALSQAVATLEQRLGVRLFNRTTRRVALLPAGESFVAAVGPALQAIGQAVEEASEAAGEPTGTLRLNMAPGAARILMPLLLEYRRRHPAVGLEVVAENALVDVVGEGFDAGVRLAEAIPPDMIAVPIRPTLRSLVVGAPDYFSKRPRPTTPADLLQQECIRFRMKGGRLYRWEFERRGETMIIDAPGRFTLDATDLVLEAALAGAGLAYLGEPAVARALKDGRLMSVLEEWTPVHPGMSLYYAQRRQTPARLRALIALIRERDWA